MDVHEHMTVCNAVMVLLLNLLLPGVGTMVAVNYVTVRRVLDLQKQVTDHNKRVKTSMHYHVK